MIDRLEKIGIQILREWDTADELDSNYREMSGAWVKKLRAALDLARQYKEQK